MQQSFGSGMAYPFRAFRRVMSDRSLRGFVLVPLGINLVLGIILYGLFLAAGFRWVDSLTAETSLGNVLEGVLRFLLGIVLFVGIAFILVRFGVVLGSPWYSKLSERIEVEQLGSAPPAEPLTAAGITRDLSRAVGFEAKKLVLTIGIGLPLLLINLLPGIGQIIGTVGGIILGAWIACLDFFDGPLERRRESFRSKLGYIRRNFPASAGFGLACVALLSIPLINLLVIPVCVAAGTLFFCDRMPQPASIHTQEPTAM